jgi:hypothetical protein
MGLKIKMLKTDVEELKKIKLPKQATEILVWMAGEYGENTVDQKDLFEALDSHLEDNKVLSVTPKQPISRIFQFYRKRLADEGIISTEKTEAEKKASKAEGGEAKSNGKKSRRKDAPVDANAGADTAADQL